MPAGEAVVRVEAREGCLVITLDRPAAANAITAALVDELLDAVRRLDEDDDLRVGVLTGAGRGFCAGMDLRAFAAEGGPERITSFFRRAGGKPLIAAVEGYALAGGLELALACDLLVAARGARLGIPEVTVGLFAGGGGVIRLAKAVPKQTAMLLALTGEPVTAERAHELGIVSLLVEPGAALAEAVRLASRIGAAAPVAVAHSAGLVRSAPGLTEDELWLAQEPLLDEVLSSRDALEGATAFTQRRAPVWTGR